MAIRHPDWLEALANSCSCFSYCGAAEIRAPHVKGTRVARALTRQARGMALNVTSGYMVKTELLRF